MSEPRVNHLFYRYLIMISLSFFLSGCQSFNHPFPAMIDLYEAELSKKESEKVAKSSHYEVQQISLHLQEAQKTIEHQKRVIANQSITIKKLKQRVLNHISSMAKQNAKTSVLNPSKHIHEDKKTRKAQLTWQSCMTALKEKSYDKAFVTLKTFNREYPESPHHASSYYLLGQLAVLQGNLDEALQYLEYFMQKYPNHIQIPDAKFHIGLAYYAKQLNQKADKIFEEIETQYPQSQVAKDAKKQRQALLQKNNTR